LYNVALKELLSAASFGTHRPRYGSILLRGRPTFEADGALSMNPRLALLQPYPFEKLRGLLKDVTPNASLSPIALSLGEPKHPTPTLISDALADHLSGLARYPLTLGAESLRAAIADWLSRRYNLDTLDSHTQVIPTLGSREAIFALTQTIVDGSKADAIVICPNPFYQIYEGASLLAGASPYFINTLAANGFRLNLEAVAEDVWKRTQLMIICSPNNPTGGVTSLEEWEQLFKLSERHGFVIASDECYSEIYLDNAKPPLGALEAAQQLGLQGYPRLIVVGSLSKRSNVPGMRSGFAAGDAALIKQFVLYRTYHGSAMSPPVQAASEVAWRDEAHVIENRRLYREKFKAFFDIVNPVLPLAMPQAAFYFWMKTPLSDIEFTKRLFQEQHLTVLPGNYLARTAHGVNPGADHVRVAMVPPLAECVDAANRIKHFVTSS
jgi:N-succinyldiaminopimelate aminotransferase